MSLNNKFELYKIRREIRRNGTTMIFYREGKNQFNEPSGEMQEVAIIKGFYYEHAPHILDAYIILYGGDAANWRTKKMPVLLCPWEDLFEDDPDFVPPSDFDPKFMVVPKRCKIQLGDTVSINGHESHVTGVYNVMEWDLVCHISFEEVDYGSQSLLPGGQKPNKGPAQEDGCQQPPCSGSGDELHGSTGEHAGGLYEVPPPVAKPDG